jgi:hypothetical protein
LADQTHVGEFQMIDQGGQVGGVVGGIGAAVDGTGRPKGRFSRPTLRAGAL